MSSLKSTLEDDLTIFDREIVVDFPDTFPTANRVDSIILSEIVIAVFVGFWLAIAAANYCLAAFAGLRLGPPLLSSSRMRNFLTITINFK